MTSCLLIVKHLSQIPASNPIIFSPLSKGKLERFRLGLNDHKMQRVENNNPTLSNNLLIKTINNRRTEIPPSLLRFFRSSLDLRTKARSLHRYLSARKDVESIIDSNPHVVVG